MRPVIEKQHARAKSFPNWALEREEIEAGTSNEGEENQATSDGSEPRATDLCRG